MLEYLIRDYTNYVENQPDTVELREVGLKELLEEIDRAHKDDTIKIAVYEIHECVLDWS